MATSPVEPGDFKCPIPRKQTGTPKLKYNLQPCRHGNPCSWLKDVKQTTKNISPTDDGTTLKHIMDC
jgi:hypothetical protein